MMKLRKQLEDERIKKTQVCFKFQYIWPINRFICSMQKVDFEIGTKHIY